MNNESIFFITKDALNRGYLPLYGNEYWEGQTPNMDYLADKGILKEADDSGSGGFGCHECVYQGI